MSLRAVAASAGLCLILVFAAAWLFQMPLGEAAIAAPIIVASVGALVLLTALWMKIAWESLRRQRHARWIVAGLVGAFALLVALSFVIEVPSRY